METEGNHEGDDVGIDLSGQITGKFQDLTVDRRKERNALGDSSSNECLNDDDDDDELLPTKLWIDDDIQFLSENLASLFEPIGLEIHPFLIGWYNEKVGEKFQLDQYSKGTLAFVVISGPEIFEKCMVPYVKARILEDPDFQSNNVLDDSVKHAITIFMSDLNQEGYETDVFYDFDLHPSRRPKVLVQTAAHVAGAVQYLHKRELPTNILKEQFGKTSNLNGVAIHPKYGGWYAIRAVIIFKNVQIPEDTTLLQRPEPVEIFTDPLQKAHVIELFAYQWQTNEWRNIHKGQGLKYSKKFLEYLNMETSKRWDHLKSCIIEDDLNEDNGALIP